jgi:glycosyltransferase involved in cell wall biosynthesis
MSSPEFNAYLRARDAVLSIKRAAAGPSGSAGEGTSHGASVYWAEELENIDYLIEATPLIVRKLRHHAFHITNVRPYDYRAKPDGRREHFEARLEALRERGGDALLVPESPALGGFGYEIDGRLFNIDTIKFYEVLIGMQQGGVLPAIRGIERPLVCEIGAGWGGFAYQFKTLFPRATVVIVDFPELFLFSATYLGAVFPDARMLFVGTEDTPAATVLSGAAWRDADFVFVPHTLSRVVSALPLDLTVNMVSFQEMTDTQVRGYAAMAASAGCPLLYSLNRERSLFNTELISVSEALSDYYRLTEVHVLDTDYTGAFKKPPKRSAPVDPSEPRYRHFVGRRDPSAGTPDAAVRLKSDTTPGGNPRVVLGMTLYNNAAHLAHAIESLLAQTHQDFVLLLLDDASADATPEVAQRYALQDPRVRYVRHAERKAMIATWREVAELAAAEYPATEYFAWVSDHDWWHPRWLERLIAELDADPSAVLAYPIVKRVSPEGAEVDKGARRFDMSECGDLSARWTLFCHDGIGAGDMVYGLMRIAALRQAGVFRPVLRPDRLLIAELTLRGRIRQVGEVLWYRRRSEEASVDRQQKTLLLPGTEPRWFHWPPWFQHSHILWREYAALEPPAFGRTRWQWARMLLRYQLTYARRHFRKTDTSHALGRTRKRVTWAGKMTRHHYHHGVYNTLMGMHAMRGKLRRGWRRAVYEVAMVTHKLGLRGRS